MQGIARAGSSSYCQSEAKFPRADFEAKEAKFPRMGKFRRIAGPTGSRLVGLAESLVLLAGLAEFFPRAD